MRLPQSFWSNLATRLGFVPKRRPRQLNSRQARLEHLEDRRMLATFTMFDAVSTESGFLSFTITASNVSAPTVVQFFTVPFTATDAGTNADFTGYSQNLTFSPSQTQVTKNVTVISDTRPEPNESFLVKLADPTTGEVLKQAVGTINDNDSILVVAPNSGYAPQVKVFDAVTTAEVFNFFPYPSQFLGGVRVATGDFPDPITGLRDGVPDIVTAPGSGRGPEIRIMNGAQPHNYMYTFPAYAPTFMGGVYVAVGDVNGDGINDVVTAAGEGGGPHVRAYSGVDMQRIVNFFVWPSTATHGVRVAVGDLNGDGRGEIIAAQGHTGSSTKVRVFDAMTTQQLNEFAPYGTFGGGAYVASGDVNGDGRADLITGAGDNGGPHVRVFDGMNLAVKIGDFPAYDPNFLGGVRVGAGDVTGDGVAEIITGPGQGGGPQVRAYSPTGEPLRSFLGFESSFTGGVFVDAEGTQQARGHIQILDNGTSVPGFQLTGSGWSVINEGYSRDVHSVTSTTATAKWTFNNLTPGWYRVATTWTGGAGRSPSVSYTLNGTLITNIDQTTHPTGAAPSGLFDAGVYWRDFGARLVTGSTLELQLRGVLPGMVIADAVRIERLAAAPQNTVPAAQLADEDTAKFFGTQYGNRISIQDPDAGAANLRVVLQARNAQNAPSGALTLATIPTGLSVSDDNTATVTMTGPLTSLNAALEGLKFQPAANMVGGVQLSITTHDLGRTGHFFGLSDSKFVQITVNEGNDAPTALNDPNVVTGAIENQGPWDIPKATLLANDNPGPGEAGQTIVVAAVSEPVGGTVAIVGDVVRFTPTTNFNGTASFKYIVADNGVPARSSDATASFSIAPVNSAPVLVDSGAPYLTAIDEDQLASVGTSVATLLSRGANGNTFTDPDGAGALRGIAVFAADSQSGQWAWSSNGGGSYTTMGSVSTTSALLLPDNALLRFVPNANFNGAVATGIQFYAWDRTMGTAYAQVNASTRGGDTPYSTTAESASINVLEINDRPTALGETWTTQVEDTGVPWNIPINGFLLTNDSAGPSNENTQSLSIASITNVFGGTAVVSGDNVVFTPTLHFSGVARFDYTVVDNGTSRGLADPQTSASAATATFTVLGRPSIDSLLALPGSVLRGGVIPREMIAAI